MDLHANTCICIYVCFVSISYNEIVTFKDKPIVFTHFHVHATHDFNSLLYTQHAASFASLLIFWFRFQVDKYVTIPFNYFWSKSLKCVDFETCTIIHVVCFNFTMCIILIMCGVYSRIHVSSISVFQNLLILYTSIHIYFNQATDLFYRYISNPYAIFPRSDFIKR